MRSRCLSACLFAAALGFFAHAYGQTEPSDGSLPPEFMKEVEGNAPPADQSPSEQNPAAQPPPQSPPPAQAPAEPNAQQAAPNIEAPAAPAAGTALGAEDYVYDPAARRDPFRPYRVIRGTEGPKRGSNEIEPLQRYDLDQLSVMGVLWDVRQPRALVRDGDGNLHTVVKNSKMGRNSGFVAMIREGEIVVIETIEDEGRTYKKTRVLEFKK
jgi:type IV pilus assembly protein PilP